MIDDVFCKIIKGELSGETVYRDDEVIVLKDIHPQAPVHLLIMPVAHYAGITDFADHDGHVLGKMMRIADRMAHQSGLDHGYRLIINEGEHGGKMVPHLHMHFLGGKKLGPKLVKED